MEVGYEIERLLNFALQKNLIKEFDLCLTRNNLLELFKITEPCKTKVNEILVSAFPVIEKLLEYAIKNHLIQEDNNTNKDIFSAKIMGLLTPTASEINEKFFNKYNINKSSATEYYYNLSIDNNYIQMNQIKKNIYYTVQTEYGDLEITINLSKPEKDPKEIENAKNVPQTGYPKCLLCKENENFSGNSNHPARQNLRLVRLNLNNDRWYMQYSPYVYYNEHCIILNKNHIPMSITKNTFICLLDFLDFLPHYFIGSNADIPIVGGSILTHEHYQGGNHEFPMTKASCYAFYKHNIYADVNIGLLNWPMNVIRMSSKNKNDLIALSEKVLNFWKNYNDSDAEVIAFTNNISHNSITPIARINKNKEYEIDLVLRNNRTSATYPFGIFHPHEHYHHIKKENIGLIEVMGLAVLPARLHDEINEITKYLSGEKIYENYNNVHKSWIDMMLKKYPSKNTKKEALIAIKNEIGIIYLNVLKNCCVLKKNANFDRFKLFMFKVGFSEQ